MVCQGLLMAEHCALRQVALGKSDSLEEDQPCR